MSEQKRCPFCGNKDIDISPISGAAWCYDCHSVSNDMDRWNTRPIEDALQSRIAALEAALVEIRDRSFRCIPSPEEIESQEALHAYIEINETGKKADRALKGEVQK